MESLKTQFHKLHRAERNEDQVDTVTPFLSKDTVTESEVNSKLSLAPKTSLKVSVDPSEDKSTFHKFPCVSYTDEKFAAEKHLTFSPQFWMRWRKAVLVLQIVAVIGSITLSVLSFKISADLESTSLFAFAVDTILAILGCFIVIWRFRDNRNGDIGPKRETFACIVYGSLFIASGIGTSSLAIYRLGNENKVQKPLSLIIIFVVSTLFYALLALASHYIAKKLESSVMVACCIDMVLNCLSVLVLVVSEVVYYFTRPSLWYLDHLGAIFIAILAVIVGAKILSETIQCRKLSRFLADSDERLCEPVS